MKEKVNAKFLKLALNLMNDQQLKCFQIELDEKMDNLKIKLMEDELSEEESSNIREEYVILKEIRNHLSIDLTINKF